MGEYKTIKNLVIESCVKEGRLPSYEVLSDLVLKHFPRSKWKMTHYTWYKSRIKKGIIRVPQGGTEIQQVTHEKSDSDVQVTLDKALSLDEMCLRISQGDSAKSNRILLFRLAESNPASTGSVDSVSH